MEQTDHILDSEINVDIAKEDIELVDFSKFFVLYIFSFGFYGIWWIYKAWKFFKERESLDIQPAARALFSIFFLYSLYEKIQRFAASNSYSKTYSSGFLVFALIGTNIGTSYLPDPYWLIGYLGGIFMIQPLAALNFAIANCGAYNVRRGGFNNRQIGVLAVGAGLWILILMGLFVPVEGY